MGIHVVACRRDGRRCRAWRLARARPRPRWVPGLLALHIAVIQRTAVRQAANRHTTTYTRRAELQHKEQRLANWSGMCCCSACSGCRSRLDSKLQSYGMTSTRPTRPNPIGHLKTGMHRQYNTAQTVFSLPCLPLPPREQVVASGSGITLECS